MKRTLLTLLGIALIATFVHAAYGIGGEVGQAAPAFSLVDTYGRTLNSADLKGKLVVIEWLNHGCPFVKKHYDGKNMQALQKKYTEQGVVWLSIVSSAPGKQGHMTNDEHNAMVKELGAAPTAVLIDEDGSVGKLYGARTTPHMFVINPEGVIVYNGAIDSKKSAAIEDIAGATNYVAQALDEVMSGKAVSVPTTQPYGCSVKY